MIIIYTRVSHFQSSMAGTIKIIIFHESNGINIPWPGGTIIISIKLIITIMVGCTL